MKSRSAVLGLGGLVWLISVGCGAESSNGDGMAGSAGVAGKTVRPSGQGGDSGDDTATGACEQGDTRACLGPARCNGAQFCDGVRWSVCDCGDAPNGGTAAGGTRAGNGGMSHGGKGGVSFGGTFADAGEGPVFNGGAPPTGGTSQGGTSTSHGGTTAEAGSGDGGEGGFVPSCGAPGQPCCSGTGRGSGTRCQKNYQCSSTGSVGKCVQCGDTWQACCVGTGAVACRRAADECFRGQCEGSGGYGGAF